MAARSRRRLPRLKIARSSTAASGRPFSRGPAPWPSLSFHDQVGAALPTCERTPFHTPMVVPTWTSAGKAGSQTMEVTGAGTPSRRSPVACQWSVPSNHHSVSTSVLSALPVVPR